MRRSLGDWPLKNRHTDGEEWATLYDAIAQNNVDDFETRWKPAMEAKLATLKTQEEVRKANIQDVRWKWGDKYRDRSNRIDFESFAVECGGETQGLMFVKTVAFSKIQLGYSIAYIDLVSTAPWNRWGFTDNPLYKGVGPLLLSAAVELSISHGFDGRLGLHALPQSEGWYQSQGLTEIGPDTNYQNLVYFEFTANDAKAYVTSN